MARDYANSFDNKLGRCCARRVSRVRLAVTLLTALVIPLASAVHMRKPDKLDDRLAGYDPEGECPTCETLFGKLQTLPTGERVMIINMQQRGEPKSGTGVMFEWATAALMRTCEYLHQMFGDNTCSVSFVDPVTMRPSGMGSNRTLLFEPAKSDGQALCPCKKVDRVQISISKHMKHNLPVDKDCAWWHPSGIAAVRNVCTFPDGREMKNIGDIWPCMYEADCTLNDHNLQMASLRDPRPVAISTFYHMEARNYNRGATLEEFVLKAMPNMCQWIAIRYILFAGLLSDLSTLYFYEETLQDPLGFHRQFLNSVGLHFPATVVELISAAAERGDMPFDMKGRDIHARGAIALEDRPFDDQISPELLEQLNTLMRQWLPPVLLAKFGVSPVSSQ